MNRFASQLVYCSPEQILKRTVIEQDENQVIQKLISLDEQPVETANTLFFDGILSAGVVSLKQNLSSAINELITEFNYIDLQKQLFDSEQIIDKKPIVFDFGTSNVNEINKLFTKNALEFSKLDIFEIIAASVYHPAKILGKQAVLNKDIKTQIILWQGLDLVNKRFTTGTRIKNLNGINPV